MLLIGCQNSEVCWNLVVVCGLGKDNGGNGLLTGVGMSADVCLVVGSIGEDVGCSEGSVIDDITRDGCSLLALGSVEKDDDVQIWALDGVMRDKCLDLVWRTVEKDGELLVIGEKIVREECSLLV